MELCSVRNESPLTVQKELPKLLRLDLITKQKDGKGKKADFLSLSPLYKEGEGEICLVGQTKRRG